MKRRGHVSALCVNSTRSALPHRFGAVAALAWAASAFAQPPMEPIGARLEYEVAVPGGAWGPSVTINPGERVEWRVKVTYTGPAPTSIEGLGQITYQPVLSNVDNVGDGSDRDQLGVWRNNGISGQGNTTLQQGLLSLAEGADSSALASYGRVHFGFTSRSTTVGSSGGLTGFRHINGSSGAPAGSFMRIAGANNPNWYPATIPNGTVELNNQIRWGVVADNNANTSTWFVGGFENVVIFRQAFIASTDAPQSPRVITLFSEVSSLRRAGGGAGTDDQRFSTWASFGITTPSTRTGVEYVPATITIVPGPGVGMVCSLAALLIARRRRSNA